MVGGYRTGRTTVRFELISGSEVSRVFKNHTRPRLKSRNACAINGLYVH